MTYLNNSMKLGLPECGRGDRLRTQQIVEMPLGHRVGTQGRLSERRVNVLSPADCRSAGCKGSRHLPS